MFRKFLNGAMFRHRFDIDQACRPGLSIQATKRNQCHDPDQEKPHDGLRNGQIQQSKQIPDIGKRHNQHGQKGILQEIRHRGTHKQRDTQHPPLHRFHALSPTAFNMEDRHAIASLTSSSLVACWL